MFRRLYEEEGYMGMVETLPHHTTTECARKWMRTQTQESKRLYEEGRCMGTLEMIPSSQDDQMHNEVDKNTNTRVQTPL